MCSQEAKQAQLSPENPLCARHRRHRLHSCRHAVAPAEILISHGRLASEPDLTLIKSRGYAGVHQEMPAVPHA